MKEEAKYNSSCLLSSSSQLTSANKQQNEATEFESALSSWSTVMFLKENNRQTSHCSYSLKIPQIL